MHASRVMDETRSTARNINHIAVIEAALSKLNSLESPYIAIVARKYRVVRTTLSRRWKGPTTNRAQAAEDKRFLNNQ